MNSIYIYMAILLLLYNGVSYYISRDRMNPCSKQHSKQVGNTFSFYCKYPMSMIMLAFFIILTTVLSYVLLLYFGISSWRLRRLLEFLRFDYRSEAVLLESNQCVCVGRLHTRFFFFYFSFMYTTQILYLWVVSQSTVYSSCDASHSYQNGSDIYINILCKVSIPSSRYPR